MVTVHQHSDVASTPVARQRPGVTPGSRLHRRLLLCGPVGSSLFILVYLLVGAARPGFDATRDTISALSLGPTGWIQILNFIVFGILTALYAQGLRATLAPGAGATAIPVLKGTQAIGLVLAGLCVMDPVGTSPATLHGTLHNLVSVVSLTITWLTCFALAYRFAREPGWRGWSAFAVVTGLLVLASLAGMGMAIGRDGPMGIFERLASGTSAPLTIAFVARVLTTDGHLARPWEKLS
jgi:hypothetical protein